jgi:hypothetical protein
MEDDIVSRIKRLYAAVNETATEDISNFHPKIKKVGNVIFESFDFRGGLTSAQLENIAHNS